MGGVDGDGLGGVGMGRGGVEGGCEDEEVWVYDCRCELWTDTAWHGAWRESGHTSTHVWAHTWCTAPEKFFPSWRERRRHDDASRRESSKTPPGKITRYLAQTVHTQHKQQQHKQWLLHFASSESLDRLERLRSTQVSCGTLLPTLPRTSSLKSPTLTFPFTMEMSRQPLASPTA